MKRIIIIFLFLCIGLFSINAQTFHFTKMSTEENGKENWELLNTTWEITPQSIFLTMNKKLTTFKPTSTFPFDNGTVFFLGNDQANSKIVLWSDDFGNKVVTLNINNKVYQFR
jgi:hypothetical protein